MIVGVDIDDTMNELTQSVASALAKEFPNIPGGEDFFLREILTSDSIESVVPGWETDDVDQFFTRNQKVFTDTEPKEYLKDMLRGLKRRFFEFRIITHRTTKYIDHQTTVNWLAKHDLLDVFNGEIHYSVDGEGQRIDKYDYQKEAGLGIEVMIEDKLPIAKEFLRHKIPVILINYPHNQDYEHKLLHRANHWWDVYQILARIQVSSKGWLR